eukprot:gene10589-1926_t
MGVLVFLSHRSMSSNRGPPQALISTLDAECEAKQSRIEELEAALGSGTEGNVSGACVLCAALQAMPCFFRGSLVAAGFAPGGCSPGVSLQAPSQEALQLRRRLDDLDLVWPFSALVLASGAANRLRQTFQLSRQDCQGLLAAKQETIARLSQELQDVRLAADRSGQNLAAAMETISTLKLQVATLTEDRDHLAEALSHQPVATHVRKNLRLQNEKRPPQRQGVQKHKTAASVSKRTYGLGAPNLALFRLASGHSCVVVYDNAAEELKIVQAERKAAQSGLRDMQQQMAQALEAKFLALECSNKETLAQLAQVRQQAKTENYVLAEASQRLTGVTQELSVSQQQAKVSESLVQEYKAQIAKQEVELKVCRDVKARDNSERSRLSEVLVQQENELTRLRLTLEMVDSLPSDTPALSPLRTSVGFLSKAPSAGAQPPPVAVKQVWAQPVSIMSPSASPAGQTTQLIPDTASETRPYIYRPYLGSNSLAHHPCISVNDGSKPTEADGSLPNTAVEHQDVDPSTLSSHSTACNAQSSVNGLLKSSATSPSSST